MFRDLTRKHQKISDDECIGILKKETRGVLSVLGDGDYPYGMPMNHWYNEEDGCIYFHCGKGGHRADSLKKNNKVSFCVFDQGVRNDNEWAYKVRSVIVFGKAEVIEDIETVVDITKKLCSKFACNEEYIKKEIESSAHKTVLIKLMPEHICGKRVVEA